jgi:hypothetical protein
MQRRRKSTAHREGNTKAAFLLNQSAHLALTVHRSARRKLATLFYGRHDCDYEETKTPGIVQTGRECSETVDQPLFSRASRPEQ